MCGCILLMVRIPCNVPTYVGWLSNVLIFVVNWFGGESPPETYIWSDHLLVLTDTVRT